MNKWWNNAINLVYKTSTEASDKEKKIKALKDWTFQSHLDPDEIQTESKRS